MENKFKYPIALLTVSFCFTVLATKDIAGLQTGYTVFAFIIGVFGFMSLGIALADIYK